MTAQELAIRVYILENLGAALLIGFGLAWIIAWYIKDFFINYNRKYRR